MAVGLMRHIQDSRFVQGDVNGKLRCQLRRK